MSDLWKTISTIGVHSQLDREDRRYVQLLNRLTATLTLGMCAILILVYPMIDEAPMIFLVTSCFPISNALVYVLNHRHMHTAARLWFLLSSACLISLNAYQLGSHSLNHYFLFTVAIGSFYIFPTRQLRLLIGVNIFVFLLLAGMELCFYMYPPIEFHSPEFIMQVRFISILGTCLFIMSMSLVNYLAINRAEETAIIERTRAENLLARLFPLHVLRRLKNRNQQIIADRHDFCSVMFIDLVGFTEVSKLDLPQNTVQNLDRIFTRFDSLVMKHNLDKIKTVGDAYMVAGGIRPEQQPQDRLQGHEDLFRMAQCALQILELAEELRWHIEGRSLPVQVRIGIHVGPVIAGVIGGDRFSYDLWGDTVNTSQRMESYGEQGRIHVSQSVYDALKDLFDFESRGPTLIKGKGVLETWYLIGIKSSLDAGIDFKIAS